MTTAWFWQSYWALVVGIFTTRVLRMAFTYAMHPYRPRLTMRAWRRMVVFSTWSWALAVTMLIRDRIDAFVIGRMLGATQVGIYSVGWEIGFAPTVELVAPLCRALFPSFSALRNREGDIANAYFRAVSAAMIVTMPASLGIALIADPLVRLAFGERWAAAIPVMQLFALVGVLRVSAIVSSTLLRVYGLQQVQIHITWISLVVRLALAIFLVSRFGLIGGALAAVVSVLIEEAGLLLATFRRFKLRAVDLLASNWRCGLASVAMAAAVLVVQSWQGTLRGGVPAGAGGLAVDVLAGAVSYTIALLAAWLPLWGSHPARRRMCGT